VLIVTTAAGCSDTTTKIVNVYSEPVAAFSATTVCFGDTTAYTDLSTTLSGSINSWAWDFGDGNNSSSTDPEHIFALQNDSFFVTLIVGTTLGCVDTVTQLVTTFPIPEMNFGPVLASGCEDYTAQFFDSSLVANGSIVNWLWDFGDGNYSYAQNPLHTYTDDGTYNISLAVMSTGGCVFFSALGYPVVVYPKPEAGFEPTPPTVSVLTPEIVFTDESFGAMYWEWDFGDFDGSILQNPSHVYPDTGMYSVMQIVINSFGCRDTMVQPIRIDPEFNYFVPNAFSPNGDGRNEIFYGQGIGYEEFRMLIFDRWGNMIFESKDQSVGWDGRLANGMEAQIDAYIYQITVRDVFGETHTIIGHFSLIR
jgi:gliding motility-associated-like protein